MNDVDEARLASLQRKPNLSRDELVEFLRLGWNYRTTKGTLSVLACRGGGPAYRRIGGRRGTPLYPRDEAERWVEAKMGPLFRSTSEEK